MKILIDLKDVYYEGIKKERILDTSIQPILMAIKHGEVIPTELGFLHEPMREATKEERESVDRYINSISERLIPVSVLEGIKAEIKSLSIDQGFDGNEECLSCNQITKIIDKHIKDYTGTKETINPHTSSKNCGEMVKSKPLFI